MNLEKCLNGSFLLDHIKIAQKNTKIPQTITKKLLTKKTLI
jgi:hypothetical protein